jgi:hypothetical protein
LKIYEKYLSYGLVQAYASLLDFYNVLPPVMIVNNVLTNDDSLITNIHDEIDGWILCEEHSQGHECTHSCCLFWFGRD